jgi:hypothetical protein
VLARQGKGFVEVTLLGPMATKGVSEPIEVFDLMGPALPALASRPRLDAGSPAIC